MKGFTRKESLELIRSQILAIEGKDYKLSYLAIAMKRENDKWVFISRKGIRYEVDASERRACVKGKYKQNGKIVLGKENCEKVKDC